MLRLLAGGTGGVKGATTADGATVEDIGRELINISKSEGGGGLGGLMGEPDPAVK